MFNYGTHRSIEIIIAATNSADASHLALQIRQSSAPIEVVDQVDMSQAIQAAHDRRPNLVLLIDEKAQSRANSVLDICQDIQRLLPTIQTLVLANPTAEESGPYLRGLMRAGVRDVLPFPPVIGSLVDTLTGIDPSDKSGATLKAHGRGQVVTVYSPKGGTGCSVFAANLGVWQARNVPGSRVVLVDLDLQFGDQATLLNLETTNAIDDLAEVTDELTPDILESVAVQHPSGLRVFPAPADPFQARPLDDSRTLKILSALRAYYDLVIIDTSTTLTDPVLAALKVADQIVQVCTPDVLSLRRNRAALQLYQDLDIPLEKVRLVLNRIQKENQIKPAEIGKLFKPQIIGAVPEDFLFLEPSVNSGLPFIETHQPKSAVYQRFNKLAEAVLAVA